MMVIDQIDQEAFDVYQVEIGYYKLFPLIMKDFITRKDAKQMMLPSNLVVNTQINVMPGQAVTGTAGPAPVSASTVSPGQGTGTGTVQPSYDGSFPHAETQILKTEIKTKEEAGGVAVESLTAPIKAVTE